MKFSFLAVVILVVVGCSKGSNPVQFSNVEKAQSVTESTDGQVNSAPAIVAPERDYTILELYLAEKITKEYVMAWFFMDIREYRNKIFDIKSEIRTKQPLSQNDIEKILVLEYAMNQVIRKFNDRNVLYRTKEVVGAAIRSAKTRENSSQEIYDNAYGVDQVRKKGLPAKAISNEPIGFLGSVTKYGFKIEEVNFLDRDVKVEY